MAMNAKRLIGAALALAVVLTPLTASANPDKMSKGEHRQLQDLTEKSGGTIQIRWDEQHGTPSFISGKLSKPLKGEPMEQALKFMDTVKALYHFDSAKKTFRLRKVQKDELGMTHVRLAHICNNIPVWGDELIVHIDKDGVVRSVNGEFTPDLSKNTERIQQPQLNSDTAIEKALADVKPKQQDGKPTAALFYFPYPEPDVVTLVYVVTIRDMSVPAEWKVFVDAMSGDVVHKYNNLKFKQKGS
ncbi:peptidase YpeB-like protein [Tumebacillus sp. BK434]|uniref:PepSY domain-containing protein n=1 Tax=Tumebacillus sp. BK434 TaxID=2512169 RepID=UPI00104E2690|nr:PepSY domain-containing protein [Tumebacillus sp. BK434]TCP54612.1 peptidase YpeB-like protein [Tumebacillus sp. BK434]